MELEFKKSCFDAYEIGGELTLTQEETGENIVPDYCPDIARIIETEGKISIHSRELRDGKAEISGTVHVSVLYTPDGEKGIRVLEFALPFGAETDPRAMPECSLLTAEADIELLETRLLNPRKVFTHCRLTLHFVGYRRVAVCACSDVSVPPEWCVEKQQEQQHTIVMTQIAEKDFTFSESMNLSPGKDGAAELLASRVCSAITETKIVGNKLILKGTFTVALLYRTTAGQCCSHGCELPFSQIMEVDGAGEGAAASVQLQMTGSDLQIDGDDPEGRRIAVTLYLHATAILREAREVTLLRDLYSTAYDLTYEALPLNLTSMAETMTRRQTVREVLEIGVVAESILSISVACGAVFVAREGNSVTLRTGATVRALYLDEGGAALVAERCIEVSCQLDLPEACRITARATCPEEPQGSLGERGIEVRFPVDFHIEATAKVKKICISTAKLNTDAPKEMVGAPSLVLRCLGKQETIWELAKQYNTTIPNILAANELETSSELAHDRLLLIPRKRA